MVVRSIAFFASVCLALPAVAGEIHMGEIVVQTQCTTDWSVFTAGQWTNNTGHDIQIVDIIWRQSGKTAPSEPAMWLVKAGPAASGGWDVNQPGGSPYPANEPQSHSLPAAPAGEIVFSFGSENAGASGTPINSPILHLSPDYITIPAGSSLVAVGNCGWQPLSASFPTDIGIDFWWRQAP